MIFLDQGDGTPEGGEEPSQTSESSESEEDEYAFDEKKADR